MSLPPGFLDDLRTRTSLAQVVGRKVMWDARKSNQGKGDLWAPCPFHQEKTASFHVDDRKGYYYCFGCHAKGDAVSFIRETENVGFMEAIEILAREAGMPMPERDPLAQAKTDRRAQLAEVMEAAVRFYRLQLNKAAGAAARAYIAKRKLSPESQARFDIGFAPDSRTALTAHLTAQGVAPALIVDAGLAAIPDGGGAPYDRFRDRIIFPIRDARGRCIGLGGRAMADTARAKYLNSPETELFDKGRSLYNHGPAREAAGKGAQLIVAEGYMDTITLVEAGFGATVAPLGTAITEDQLRLMWRIHPEPVIALDGDKAGVAAALRLIDLALPLLEAGNGLRFCLLPQGLDPDDLIRAQGAGAMQKLVDAAEPMVALLWRRETEGRVFDSPERRAALDKVMRALIQTIRDPSIRAHYEDEIKRLRWELLNARRTPTPVRERRTARGQRGPWKPEPLPPLSTTKATLMAARHGGNIEDQPIEAVILAVLVTHPALIVQFESQLEQMVFGSADHQSLGNALLRSAHDGDVPARLRELVPGALERLLATNHVRSSPPLRKPGDVDLAMMCLAEELAKLEARRGMRREIDEAVEDMAGMVDEGLTWRLSRAAQASHEAVKSKPDDSNDLGEDRAGMSQQLDNLIDGQVWVKKTR